MSSNYNKPVVIVAAGALYDQAQHSILMCQRSTKGAHPSAWEFPGGKLEQDENPERALIRELKEELSLDIKIGDIRPAGFASYEYEKLHVVILLYIVEAWTGAITLNDHQAMQWIKVADLPQFQALPADKPLLEGLARYI